MLSEVAPATGVQGIHHVALQSRNVAAAEVFYRDVLGFRVSAVRTRADNMQRVLLQGANGTWIEIVPHTEENESALRPSDSVPSSQILQHVGLLVSSVHEFRKRLTAVVGDKPGIAELALGGARARVMSFLGPDGEQLQAIEWQQ